MTALAASTYVPSECSLSPADVTHARMAPPDAVAEAVRRWGIAVFPGLVTGELLAGLNAEFDRMIALRRDLGVPVDEYGNIVNLRLTRTGLSPAVFPATAGFFAQPFMAAVAAARIRALEMRAMAVLRRLDANLTSGGESPSDETPQGDKRSSPSTAQSLFARGAFLTTDLPFPRTGPSGRVVRRVSPVRVAASTSDAAADLVVLVMGREATRSAPEGGAPPARSAEPPPRKRFA